MGRSSAEQALQNREKIVGIASALFRAHGVEAVSVADIMAGAGMTVGGFYKHFASKDALVEEATARAFDEAAALWQQFFAPADTPDHGSRAALVAHYLRPEPQNRCPIIAFAPYSAEQEPQAAAKEAYDRGASALLGVFDTENRPANGQPQADAADPDSLVLFAAMVGARILGEAAGDSAWVEALRNAVIAHAAGK